MVAAWGIPLLVGLTYLGGWWTTTLVAAVALGAQLEYYRLQSRMGRRPLVGFGLAAGAGVVAAWGWSRGALPWVMAAAVITTLLGTVRTGRSHADGTATLFGICLGPLLAGTFQVIRSGLSSGGWDAFEGQDLAIGLWGVLWVGDTAAYAGGKWLGSRKLAPDISPHKTIEGFGFGLMGAAGFGLGWSLIRNLPLDVGLVCGLTAGTAGQLGDLAESRLKREVGVKDSSGLLPGHGGVLDRFDSFLVTSPVVTMYLLVRQYLLPM